ncbi:WbqC family protein [Candidatus Albibeggiatoa sp. nov. NOAA]|uniref:WbqC family protein n=1 Tax=Candidatus Albibeggiatoa sp. nov. NOAA TaxID=3162724 RepID=UPI0032FB5B88|nr:WbqC family protein [Thiotrichaceae bacterium]
MKVAIMQPYFLPYIGYFQLIQAVDKFIILDDVNYIPKGWINRNRILVNHQPYLFTLPLQKASQNKKINELYLEQDLKQHSKLLKTIYLAYKKAPYFEFYSILEEIVHYPKIQLINYIEHSLQKIMIYLNIQTQMIKSASVYQNQHLKGQARILDICQQEQADTYINLMGGQALYDKNAFAQAGIQLQFIQTQPIVYKQFSNHFVPNLSIIDVLMFNSTKQSQFLLNQYQLV